MPDHVRAGRFSAKPDPEIGLRPGMGFQRSNEKQQYLLWYPIAIGSFTRRTFILRTLFIPWIESRRTHRYVRRLFYAKQKPYADQLQLCSCQPQRIQWLQRFRLGPHGERYPRWLQRQFTDQ